MQASRQVFLLVVPVLALLGVISIWSRREPSREASVVPNAPEPQLVDVASPVAAPQLEPTTREAMKSAPPAASAIPPLSEDSLATEMHSLEDSNPALALELARQGQTQWPNGPRAAEFAATEVKCLYRLGNPSAGRGAAEAMVNKYVGSPWAIEVERQTGAHAYVNH
jgi:hypothetical protein